MHSALADFRLSIQTAKDLSGLYQYLSATHAVPFPFDDLLRSQLVYAVSAFDKLVHDLIRIGMVETFVGTRAPTDKYHAETITIKFHRDLVAATIPPQEFLFNLEVARKLSFISFQDPQKVSDGLSLIWSEAYKWQKIAASLSMPAEDAKTKLKIISMRRNAIVHESDWNPVTGGKKPISLSECDDVTDFIERCGMAITTLVL
jgi:hypothetical protein